MLSSDPRPKCKVLIFTATKKREKDTSNPPPATKGAKQQCLAPNFMLCKVVKCLIISE
nr:MAG TPA: hypothetical protein [Caudoviricetes sp.]